MLFAYLVLFSSLVIEGIGTYVSVVGLSSLFASNLVIIALAMSLDLGKIVCVSFLWRHWSNINFIMRSYMLAATVVLIIITSAGAFGFLSQQFQNAIANTNESGVMITALTEEQGRLQLRKQEIDAQIAKLPDNSVRGRTLLIKQFAPEVNRINDRLVSIDEELPKLKIETIKKNVEVGPIIYIAEAFDTTPERAVKWVIMVIIFVFDPLAIALLLAGNYLLLMLKQEAAKIKDAEKNNIPKVEVALPVVKQEINHNETLATPQVVAIKISPDDIINTDYAELTPSIVKSDAVKEEVVADLVSAQAVKDVIAEELPVEESQSEEVPVTNDTEIAAQLETFEVQSIEIPAKHDDNVFENYEAPPVDQEDPKTTESDREIITLDQITGQDKIHRSILESISTKSDVIMHHDNNLTDSSLLKRYTAV